MTSRKSYLREYQELSEISDWFELAALIAALVVGVFYLWYQFSTVGRMADPLFVTILLGSTAILLAGERYTQKHLFEKGLEFFSYSLNQEVGHAVIEKHRILAQHLFQSKYRIATGVGYGVVVAGSPVVLRVWANAPELQLALCTFLFFVNYITGTVMYSLARFVIDSKWLSQQIKVDVWNSRNPSSEFYIRSILNIGLIASTYVSISMTSILFSKFDRTAIVLLYIVFSFSVLVVVLVYPYIPIVRRMLSVKRELRDRIGHRLHSLTENALRTPAAKEADEVLEEMRRLLELRKAVEEVSLLPFRSVTVWAVAVMAFIFSHPLILEWLLGAHLFMNALNLTPQQP